MKKNIVLNKIKCVSSEIEENKKGGLIMKSLIKGKQGKGGAIALTLISVALLIGVLLGAYFLFAGKQSAVDEKQTTNDCGGSDPLVTLTMLNAINKGSTVTPNSIDGWVTHSDGSEDFVASITSGTTKFAYGDVVKLLVGEPSYINTTLETKELSCGSNAVTGYIYDTADSSITVFNDEGNVVTDINDATSTVNQTARSTNILMEVKFTANSDQSSGDLIVVIESANTTEVNDIVLSGATKINLPKSYTMAGSGSYAVAYEVPALIDGDSKTYNILITPETGKTMGGQRNAFYLTAYSKQSFKDLDGSFAYGIEDSDGTATYVDDFDYDWNVD